VDLIPVDHLPELHVTPLARVVVEGRRVTAEIDDPDECRWRLVFEPYQAVRLITADCFIAPGELAQNVLEVRNSPWIQELKQCLAEVDHSAKFLEEAHHFLLPLQDEFMEVISWNVRAEPVTSV
jgi:hypothetical protein